MMSGGLMADRFERLVAKCVKLGNSFPIMPVDEIRLAVSLAELPEQRTVVPRLFALFDHENMHVRRIAINACRRSGMFDVPGLAERLTRKLTDEQAWVRYDAAWTIQTARFDSQDIRAALARISEGVVLEADEARVRQKPGDAELQARVRAKQTLTFLEAQPA